MNRYLDIVDALNNHDLPFIESLAGLLKHHTKLKNTFQTNYLELKEGSTKDFFFKLYIMDNGKWDFFDFGWLKIVKTNVGATAIFHTNKSKLLIFTEKHAQINTWRREDSLKHAIVLANDVSYLLFNPTPEVFEIMIDQIHCQKKLIKNL